MPQRLRLLLLPLALEIGLWARRLAVRGGRLHEQYCPGAVGWVCRPEASNDTDLTLAFEAA